MRHVESLYANELLAIIYGLSVCFDDSIDKALELMEKSWFNEWVVDFRYLLHARHYTAESLAFLFETLLKILDYNEEQTH